MNTSLHILKKLYEMAVTELCPLLLLFGFTTSLIEHNLILVKITYIMM